MCIKPSHTIEFQTRMFLVSMSNEDKLFGLTVYRTTANMPTNVRELITKDKASSPPKNKGEIH